MSDQPSEDQDVDLPALDADQFVGGPPAGDGTPGEFASGDQSADPTDSRDGNDDDDDDSEDDR